MAPGQESPSRVKKWAKRVYVALVEFPWLMVTFFTLSLLAMSAMSASLVYYQDALEKYVGNVDWTTPVYTLNVTFSTLVTILNSVVLLVSLFGAGRPNLWVRRKCEGYTGAGCSPGRSVFLCLRGLGTTLQWVGLVCVMLSILIGLALFVICIMVAVLTYALGYSCTVIVNVQGKVCLNLQAWKLAIIDCGPNFDEFCSDFSMSHAIRLVVTAIIFIVAQVCIAMAASGNFARWLYAADVRELKSKEQMRMEKLQAKFAPEAEEEPLACGSQGETSAPTPKKSSSLENPPSMNVNSI